MKSWNFRVLLPVLAAIIVLFVFVPDKNKSVILSPRRQNTVPDNYITRVFTDASGMQMTYYLYIPANYNPQEEYPLVLLLQGGGERAQVNNTPAQNRALQLNQAYALVWGPGYSSPYPPKVQQHWPSFIVIPQVVAPHQFVLGPAWEGSYTLAQQPTDALRMSKEIVDALQKQYTNIDPHRLYITGLSMGGYGAWDAIERWPTYFAAAAPLAGAGDPTKASRLVNLPIWAFHGGSDSLVPVSGSRDMIQAIKAAGGHPRYTEFPGVNHVIWDIVYSTANTPSPVPNFFSWLFSQRNIYPMPTTSYHLCPPKS
ncbi:MAG TPA: prolyl oligopeptidase family serine peptidase [Ktedonobacteraceae bacterium]|nr:prolyl oligopeptidase family serine peptidase [Ktedonobacteraceae bacterium]